MAQTKIRIASRASPLAVAQAQLVAQALAKLGCSAEIIKTESAGDKIAGSLADVGGKELFINTVRQLLVDGKADCAVHSLKDMAAEEHSDFTLAAVGFAEDPRDVFVSAAYPTLDELPDDATIGTGSPRRAALLARSSLGILVKTILTRGNIQTRLQVLGDGKRTALILAAAGLRRLGLITDSNSNSKGGEFMDRRRKYFYQYLPANEFIPAPGQGLLAVECLAKSSFLPTLAQLSDEVMVCRAEAERAFSRAIGGDCHTPLGAYARLDSENITIYAFHNDPKRGFLESEVSFLRCDISPADAGKVAAEMLAKKS